MTWIAAVAMVTDWKLSLDIKKREDKTCPYSTKRLFSPFFVQVLNAALNMKTKYPGHTQCSYNYSCCVQKVFFTHEQINSHKKKSV